MNGLLVMDKPVGPTSHDVVNRVRRLLSTRRVGHTGTLDPFASGVLILCVGQATRLAEYVTAQDKVYEATVVLGVGTDTLDVTGTVTERGDASQITEQDVLSALRLQVGRIEQVPPEFSAVHVGGRRAYELAREGKPVALTPRTVDIHELTLLRGSFGDSCAEVLIRVHCGSGTYVRSICRDLAKALQLPGHLRSLVRTRVGHCGIENATSLMRLEELAGRGRGDEALLPMAMAVKDYVSHCVRGSDVSRVRNGAELRVSRQMGGNGERVSVVDSQGHLRAIYRVVESDELGARLRAEKVFDVKEDGT